MHFRNLFERGYFACANGPDRLIGYDNSVCCAAVRNGAFQLGADDRERVTRLTLSKAFADTDNRNEAGRLSRRGFIADCGVGFAVSLAAFLVSCDDITGACIRHHYG